MNTPPPGPNQESDRLEPPGDDLLAGEYVLGVLDTESHRRIAARVARDAVLAREVAGWEARLAPLLDAIEPVAPPLGLWPRVRAHVGLSTDATAARVPLWKRLGFWRGFSAAGLAATAASLGALFFLQPALDRPGPRHPQSPHPITLLTTIANTDGAPAFIAAVDADACTLLVMPTADARVPTGKVAELWVIASDGAPRSLGVRSTRDMQAVPVPVNLRDGLLAAATLAVSVEPPGGSPTGLPTGAVFAKGALTRLTL